MYYYAPAWISWSNLSKFIGNSFQCIQCFIYWAIYLHMTKIKSFKSGCYLAKRLIGCIRNYNFTELKWRIAFDLEDINSECVLRNKVSTHQMGFIAKYVVIAILSKSFYYFGIWKHKTMIFPKANQINRSIKFSKSFL